MPKNKLVWSLLLVLLALAGIVLLVRGRSAGRAGFVRGGRLAGFAWSWTGESKQAVGLRLTPRKGTAIRFAAHPP